MKGVTMIEQPNLLGGRKKAVEGNHCGQISSRI